MELSVLEEILERRKSSISKSFPFYVGKNKISENKKVNAINKFANKIHHSEIIALFDGTVMGSCKRGIIFTENSMFWNVDSKNEKVNYINIEKVYVQEGKDDQFSDLYLELKDESKKQISCSYLSKIPLKITIEEIIHAINGNILSESDKFKNDVLNKISDKRYKDSIKAMKGCSKNKTNNSESKEAESAARAYSNANAANIYADNVVFNGTRGHGFAAEKANDLYDKLSGKDAKIIGGDNAKNGADRLVDGIKIQTKYCKTGSKCISECFDKNGQFRYIENGNIMQIEVPKDKHEDAIKAMRERIKKGQVPGVTNPDEAKNIVRKGHFSYDTVKKIAKAGTIESITYDAVNGIVTSGITTGISSSITFAISIWNGEDIDIAIEKSIYSGMKIFGQSWVTSILTTQLGRTAFEKSLRPATDFIVKKLGPKASAKIINSLRNISNKAANGGAAMGSKAVENGSKAIHGGAAMNSLSKVLRGNIATTMITTTVLSSADITRLLSGSISGSQAFKNIAVTATSVGAGAGGWMAGATAGSVIPVVGTVIGGLAGSIAASSIAAKGSKKVMDQIIDDDSVEICKILESTMMTVCEDYLFNQTEIEKLVLGVQKLNLEKEFRNIYGSKDRESYCYSLLEPLADFIIINRPKIILPSEEEYLLSMVALSDDEELVSALV